MNRSQLAAALVAVSVFFIAGSATGAVIDADGDPLTPAGHPDAIFDSTTNLLWLDATETQNRALADVQSELGVGGEFAGWQSATRSQIHQLFTNANLAITAPGPRLDSRRHHPDASSDSSEHLRTDPYDIHDPRNVSLARGFAR